ncbi:hypothetical protein QR680_011944 [Steinernema hermaphroditum]|uniref:Nuclear receptor domain-containing protein n=1 Tax=Steinernema hermaphroditum TaxID=289476 RepID=A0AA39I2T1_9BILA|nr:hypothetical protein QR680_011944 [Steinernema hermaphroditum]
MHYAGYCNNPSSSPLSTPQQHYHNHQPPPYPEQQHFPHHQLVQHQFQQQHPTRTTSAPVTVYSPLQLDVDPNYDPRAAAERKISAAYNSVFYSPASICSSTEPSSKIQTPRQSSFDAPASEDTGSSTLSASGLSGSLENIHMEDLFNTPDHSPINVSTPTASSQLVGSLPEGNTVPQLPPPPSSSAPSTTGYTECDELSLPSSSSVFPDTYLPSSRNPRLDQRSKSLITETDRDLERLLDQMLEFQTQLCETSASDPNIQHSSAVDSSPFPAVPSSVPSVQGSLGSLPEMDQHVNPQAAQHVKPEPAAASPVSFPVHPSTSHHALPPQFHLLAGSFPDFQRHAGFLGGHTPAELMGPPSTFQHLAQQAEQSLFGPGHHGAAQFYGHGMHHPPPPMHDSRRGSHGTTSSTNSQTGTPSPLAHQQPLSPSFAQHMRFQQMFSAPQDVQSFMAAQTHNLPSLAPSSSNVNQQPQQQEQDKLCAVCNDSAVCQHYGARTCEGCKGFFKRSVQKKAQYVCSGNKNCPIDKRYRSRCQYCRYQKCLQVGMVKEVVRFGPLSGRRGRLPSKTKCQQSDEPPSPPLPVISLIAKAFSDMRQVDPSVQGYKSYPLNEFILLLDYEYKALFAQLSKVPGLGELLESDRAVLLARSFFAIFALKQCRRMANSLFVFERGEHLELIAIPEAFRHFFMGIQNEAAQFQQLCEWDSPSYCTLLVLQYLGTSKVLELNMSPLIGQNAVDKVKTTLINALKDHCCSQSNPQQTKLAKIVAQVTKFAAFQAVGTEALTSVQNLPLPQSLLQVLHQRQ